MKEKQIYSTVFIMHTCLPGPEKQKLCVIRGHFKRSRISETLVANDDKYFKSVRKYTLILI